MAINLGPGPQNFVGTDVSDRINGNGGNDTIRGRGGDDRISGNRGNDNLFGNGGDDDLFGNQGRDHLVGGFGNDELFGGSGRDRLDGSQGDDDLTGGGGGDRFLYNTTEGHDDILDFSRAEGDRIQIEDLNPTQLIGLAESGGGSNPFFIDNGDFRAFLDSPVATGAGSPDGGTFVLFNFNGPNNSLFVDDINQLFPGDDIV